MRDVAEGVSAIAHRRRASQLLHRHSDSTELLGFKSRLDTAFQVLIVSQVRLWLLSIIGLIKAPAQLQCGLQTRQMLEHVAADLRRILENQHEQARSIAALHEKVEPAHGHSTNNHGNLDQFLRTLTVVFDNSKVMSTHSLSRDPINLLTPMMSMDMLVKA